MTGQDATGQGTPGPDATGQGTSRQGTTTSFLACDEPLSSHYDVALLDLDGVVYLGGHAVPGAAGALNDAVKAGMRLAFVTNNAYRTPSAICAQLTGLGVPATPADVVTSAQAAARLLAERLPPGSAVLVIGGTFLRAAVRERGLRPVSSAAVKPAAVVQGYSPGIGYAELAEGALAVEAGALFVATNADPTLPTPRGPQPGNGSMVQVIANATGVRPLVAGKPETPLHAESVQRTGARRPLAVGDRLDTDIEGACRVGADSLLVLTGVTTPADLLLARPDERPSYLSEGLAGLLHPHPAVTQAGGGYACGGWTATANSLGLNGSGDRIDGLRALAAAAWSTAGITRDAATAALRQLDQA